VEKPDLRRVYSLSTPCSRRRMQPWRETFVSLVYISTTWPHAVHTISYFFVVACLARWGTTKKYEIVHVHCLRSCWCTPDWQMSLHGCRRRRLHGVEPKRHGSSFLVAESREPSVISWLRTYQNYPRVCTRTKRYCSFIHYALNYYQDSILNH